MDYSSNFAISAAGMAVERLRVETASLNLANANTVQGPGSGWRPLRVLVQAGAATSFEQTVAQGLAAAAPVGLVAPMNVEPRKVYEPGHPLADDKGFVSYANVDPAAEMVTLMSATRNYEANVAAFNTTRTLAMRDLEIGSGS